MRHLVRVRTGALWQAAILLCIAAEVGGGPANGQSLSQSQANALTGNCAAIGPARGPQLGTLCSGSPGPSSGVSAPEGGNPSAVSDQGGEDQERRTKRRLEELRNEKAAAPTRELREVAQGSVSGGISDGSSGTFNIGQLSGFVNFDYQNVSKHTTYFTNGFNSDRYGGTIGVDHSFDNLVLGASLEYSHTSANFKSNGGTFDIDSYGGALYGSVTPQPNMFIDASIGYAHKDNTINRGIAFSNTGNTLTAAGTARGAASSNEYRANISGGYDFVRDNITFGPRLGFAYTRNKVEAFRETGSTGLELAFGQQTFESLTSSVGGQATIAISTSFGVIVPQFTADYIHEFKDNQQTFNAHFVQDLNAAPTTLVFQTDQPDRNYFALGIGVVLGLPHGISSFLNYRALVGDVLKTTQTVTAGVRMEF